jgi:hypothetical protein
VDARHKKKAYIGVAIWVAAIPLAFAIGLIARAIFHRAGSSNPDSFGGVVFITLVIAQYIAFFWGASHLAKAKGYTSAMVLLGICWPGQFIVLALLLFALPDKLAIRRSRRTGHEQRHGESESLIARVVRYRRNAFVANIFGVTGILIALAIFSLPLGLFEQRDNARVAAILTFIPSYGAVIYGCYWWVRAKHWHEAVVFIGLMPLAPLFIPFVRLIYFRTSLWLVGMVIMPLILISVVAVLPDKSGMPKRKRWDRD